MDQPSSSSSPGHQSASSQTNSSSFRLRPSSLSAQIKSSTDTDADQTPKSSNPSSPPSGSNSNDEVVVNSLSVPTSSSSRSKPETGSMNKTGGKFFLRPSVLKVSSGESSSMTPTVSVLTSSSSPNVLSSSTDSTLPGSPSNSNSGVSSSTSSSVIQKNPSVIQRVSSEANGVSSSSPAVSVISSAPPATSRVIESIQTPVIKVNGSVAGNIVRQSNPAETGAGFVFGQNLSDRVILPATPPDSTDAGDYSSGHQSLQQQATSSCSKTDRQDRDEGVKEGDNVLPTASSTTSCSKRKYEAITGEEDESNVLQIHCKLYQWEKESTSWKEKGKGFLKLNDKKLEDKLSSRLVMRTSGSLKVILNCSLVTGMNFSKSSETSLKFTNFTGVYSVKGKEKDIDLLYSAVNCRLRELESKRVRKGDDDDDSSPVKSSVIQKHPDRYEEDEDDYDDTNDSTAVEHHDEDEAEEEGEEDSLHHVASSANTSRGSAALELGTGVTSSCSSSPGSTSHSHPSSSSAMRRDDSGRDADAEDDDEEEEEEAAVDADISSQGNSQAEDHFHTIRDQKEESNTNDASLSSD